jgi:hypothetical protein
MTKAAIQLPSAAPMKSKILANVFMPVADQRSI